MRDMTSVKKRLDHVLNEIDSMGTKPNMVAAKNVVAELKVIKGAYHETNRAPMCCFRCDNENNLACDFVGPLDKEHFMEKCRQCQTQIKTVLVNLKID
jgi:hypothetical protein